MSQTTTHPLSSPHAAASVIIAAALPLLLMIAEASGLSTPVLRSASLLMFALSIAFLVITGRTSQEALFFGRRPLLRATRGGAVVGTVTFALLLPFIAHSMIHFFIAAFMIGAGILAGALMGRHWRNPDNRNQSPMVGVLIALAGFSLMLAGFAEATREWALLTAQTHQVISFSIAATAVLLLALGGWRATLSFLGVLAVVALASAALASSYGIFSIGPPPLPMFSDASTLEPINALRLGFNLNALPFPDTTNHFGGVSRWFGSLALFAIAAGSVAAFLQPAVEDQPVKFAASAALSFAALGCMAIAIGGYALEAAGREFFNNPISQPAAGLLESARQGLITICGSTPTSEDALLAACQTSALSKTLLAPDKVRLDAAFLALGLPHALGFGQIASLLANLWKPALSLMLVMAGLLAVMTGLGHHIFCMRYQRPGLASFRIALMRVAAVMSVALMVWLAPLVAMKPDALTARYAAVMLMMLATMLGLYQAITQKRNAQQEPVADATPPKPQRQGSPKGMPAEQG